LDNVKSDTNQFVGFNLSGELCAVDIKKVTIIEKLLSITRVPKVPKYFKGVINLRGEIIPVVDLRVKFEMNIEEDTEETRILVLKIDEITVGIIVDYVEEVLSINNDSIESVTSFDNGISLDYIQGLGKVGDKIITILNIEKLKELGDFEL
jgi:purine-binding chemotaxis protein CheW